eukprot:scaffold197563_cov20-Tisochrysis_lutea.AAC.1
MHTRLCASESHTTAHLFFTSHAHEAAFAWHEGLCDCPHHSASTQLINFPEPSMKLREHAHIIAIPSLVDIRKRLPLPSTRFCEQARITAHLFIGGHAHEAAFAWHAWQRRQQLS